VPLDDTEGSFDRPRNRAMTARSGDAADAEWWLSFLFAHSTRTTAPAAAAAQFGRGISISQRPAYSAENAMRWVCFGSIASVSSQTASSRRQAGQQRK